MTDEEKYKKKVEDVATILGPITSGVRHRFLGRGSRGTVTLMKSWMRYEVTYYYAGELQTYKTFLFISAIKKLLLWTPIGIKYNKSGYPYLIFDEEKEKKDER